MKPKKSDLNRISKYLWEQGHGSKTALSNELGGCSSSIITRMLKGGGISEEKFNQIIKIINK
jgi:hypothetical protein